MPIATPIAKPLSSPALIGRSNPARHTAGAGSQVPITAHRLVSPGYPATLGVKLVAGRLLDGSDREGSLPVAVVSEELVRQAWPSEARGASTR